ncbi:hypothetical protein [Jhaorihella thermophila]|uniref:Uncharacterized protein n=1 Tax=Jhaorihella thermophila TaxID=488547 RepID=A0A1H5T9J2_9RHOB|nr:hypothetical protein [Jhaorihella thermophila]SEF59450.1 hypothetical protein SAMN05421751_102152 [Jhaorihella thermophila]
MLAYLAVAGTFGFLFAGHQPRLAGRLRRLNRELAADNDLLAGISHEIIPYEVTDIKHAQAQPVEVPTDDGGVVRIDAARLNPATRARLRAALDD